MTNRPKITIIGGLDGAHQNDLKSAAKKRGLDASIRTITTLDLLDKKLSAELGDAVVWRSSDLDLKSERPSMEPILRNKIVVSDGLIRSPMLYLKYFQQQLLFNDPVTSKWSIPTFRFKQKAQLKKAIADGMLKLPIIVKPNAGSRGEGISLLKQLSDISDIEHINDYVFQSFIPNDGDWRVVVIGGSPVAVVLRRGAKEDGQFVNNISKGAKASEETDPEVLDVVRMISTKVASLFHLAFCGVDVIRDSETGKYYVLEVNTAPQWTGEDDGFKVLASLGVPELIIDWIIDRYNAKSGNLYESIESYYKKRINQIPTEAFHFASRLWLWSNDEWARQQLDDLQQYYIGKSPDEIEATVQKIINSAKGAKLGVNQKSSYRKEAYAKYDKLPMYNLLLYKVLFGETIYGLDVRPYVRKYISDKEFINLFIELVEDKDAVCLLSTHAINYFYLLKNYFKDKISLSSAVLVSPDEMIGLLPHYKKLEKSGKIDHKLSLKLQIYLLTHMIIGESRFYAKKIRLSQFKRVFAKLEQLIGDNYFDLSLDNKIEFLVCGQICGYESDKRSIIEQEASKSVSWAGNFLVDSFGLSNDSRTADCLRLSEHRNVLYIMSQKQFARENDGNAVNSKMKPPVIGRLARVKLHDYGIRRAIARVDSGAVCSAIDASNIHVEDDGLHFTLLNDENSLYNGVEHVVKDYTNINIRNTTSEQARYAVMLKIEVNGELHDISFTLSDRKKMLYPILLGRNFLTGRYTVDTAKQLVERRKTSKRKG